MHFPRREGRGVPRVPYRVDHVCDRVDSRARRFAPTLAWRATRQPARPGVDGRHHARYVSFVETGRASPSRAMVVRLARALDIPLRERNELPLAAGFAPLYRAEPLDSPALARVRAALDAMLAQHDPLPAVVMDRGWNVVQVNEGAAALFGRMFAPATVPADANVLRLFLAPGPVRGCVVNWSDVATALFDRARREAVGGVLDQATATLLAELQADPDVAAAIGDHHPQSTAPVLDVQFEIDGEWLSFFSVVSTIGTPIDVTAQELRVELFYPAP